MSFYTSNPKVYLRWGLHADRPSAPTAEHQAWYSIDTGQLFFSKTVPFAWVEYSPTSTSIPLSLDEALELEEGTQHVIAQLDIETGGSLTVPSTAVFEVVG